MAETLGTLADKLSIVELRKWHTEEAMCNPTAPVDVRHECALRLRLIDEQRADLIAEIAQMWDDVVRGRRTPKVYKQLKMYNDDRLRQASGGSSRREEALAPDNVVAFIGSRP